MITRLKNKVQPVKNNNIFYVSIQQDNSNQSSKKFLIYFFKSSSKIVVVKPWKSIQITQIASGLAYITIQAEYTCFVKKKIKIQ